MTLPAGRHFFRGTADYETARRATVWNGLLPERFPEVIVRAGAVDEVVAALRYADEHDLQVGVCSGGHSWSASHLRDGGMLLHVGDLDDCSIDPERRTAVVGPGVAGDVFGARLDELGLFFPVGHCRGVRLGGYLLQGGYGWNSRVLGPACESVIGVDVVTAAGERLYCDAVDNAELYWAARGSGPGFFAVVTGFHLRLHPRPAVCGSCLYIYSADLADELFTWARAISPHIDDRVELQVVTARGLPAAGIDEPTIIVASPAFADSEDEAQRVLAVLGSCPVVDRAIVQIPYLTRSLNDWYDAVMHDYPPGHRYVVDNMWTSASAADLLPGIHRIIDTMPPPPSHFLMFNWTPAPRRRDQFYGLEDEINLALYTAWPSADDDTAYSGWAATNLAALAHLSSGIGLADENLGRRPALFATAENMARLQHARAAYDPDRRFHSWMGRT